MSLKKLTILLSISSASLCFAGPEYIKIDLADKSTKIVVADVGVGRYFIDKTACLCWLNVGAESVTSIDCNKLKAHPKLAPHLQACN